MPYMESARRDFIRIVQEKNMKKGMVWEMTKQPERSVEEMISNFERLIDNFKNEKINAFHVATYLEHNFEQFKTVLTAERKKREEAEEKSGDEHRLRIKYQDVVYKICALFDASTDKLLVTSVVNSVKELKDRVEKAEARVKEVETTCIAPIMYETAVDRIKALEQKLAKREKEIEGLKKKLEWDYKHTQAIREENSQRNVDIGLKDDVIDSLQARIKELVAGEITRESWQYIVNAKTVRLEVQRGILIAQLKTIRGIYWDKDSGLPFLAPKSAKILLKHWVETQQALTDIGEGEKRNEDDTRKGK